MNINCIENSIVNTTWYSTDYWSEVNDCKAARSRRNTCQDRNWSKVFTSLYSIKICVLQKKKPCLNKTNQSLVLRSESFSPLNEKIFNISIHSCAPTTPHQHVSKIRDRWSIHHMNHFEAHPSIESNELTTKKAKGFKFAAQTNDGGKASNSRNIM